MSLVFESQRNIQSLCSENFKVGETDVVSEIIAKPSSGNWKLESSLRSFQVLKEYQSYFFPNLRKSLSIEKTCRLFSSNNWHITRTWMIQSVITIVIMTNNKPRIHLDCHKEKQVKLLKQDGSQPVCIWTLEIHVILLGIHTK